MFDTYTSYRGRKKDIE